MKRKIIGFLEGIAQKNSSRLQMIIRSFTIGNRRCLLLVILIGTAGGLFLNPLPASAADITSTATGGTWATGSTWVGGTAPATTDNAIIATTGSNAVNIVTSTTIANLTINSGATLTHTSSKTLGVTGNYSNSGTHTNGTGAFTLSGSGATINGSGSEGGTGAFTLSTAKTINAAANLTVAQTIAITAAVTITNNGTINANGAITGSAAGSTWSNASGATLNVKGALLATGTLTPAATANTINYNGTAAQTIKVTTTNPYYHLTLSGGSTKTSIAGLTSIAGNFTLSDTNTQITLLALLTVTGDINVGTGTTLNCSTFLLTGNGNLTVGGILSGSGGVTLSGAATKTLYGSGTISNTGAFTLNTGAKAIDSTANLNFSGPSSIAINIGTANSGTITATNAIAIAAATTFTNNGTVNANGAITGANATTSIWSNAANSTLNVKGALLTTGALTAAASPNTVKYNSTTAGQTIKSTTYHHLTIDKSGQTGTLGGGITVNGDLTITVGILDTNNSNINVAGSWSNSGNFTAGTGAVQFTSASQSDITGTTTFYDLTVDTNAAGAKTVRFGAGQEQTVSHTLTLKGYAGKVLTIRSTTDSTDAFLKLQVGGTQSLDYLDVYDNNASNGQTLAGGVNSTLTRTTNWTSKIISVTLRDATDTSDYTTWAIGSNKSLDTVYLMTAGNCVLVKNNGNVSEDFSISAVGTNWTLGSSTAENTCVLMGLFNGGSAPAEGSFSTTNDLINGSTVWATQSSGNGKYEGTNDGDNVSASTGEKLYIYLKTPSSLSQGSEESITVTVGCREH